MKPSPSVATGHQTKRKRPDDEVKQPEAKKQKSPIKSSTVVLSLKEFKKWTAPELAAVLMLDDEKGGADLSKENVQPLVDILVSKEHFLPVSSILNGRVLMLP